MYDSQAAAKRFKDARARLLDARSKLYAPTPTRHTPTPLIATRPAPQNCHIIPAKLLPDARRPGLLLSPNTSNGLECALEHGLAKGTHANYSSAVHRFMNFCERENINIALRFPANEYVLCAFVGSLTNEKSGHTSSNIIAGLKAWHALHDQPWKGGYLLAHVLRGSAMLAPPSSRHPPRPPVTTQMLEYLHADLDFSSACNRAIWAAALTAFWGQCRLGELLGTSRQRHDPRSHPSRLSLRLMSSAQPSAELLLPQTKTNQLSGQSVHLTQQKSPLSPIHTLSALINTSPTIPPSHHLFAFPNAKGGISCLTKETFLSQCNKIWRSRGLPRMTGHSFRIGGTHAYLAAGVPDDVVKKMGCWASDAFLRYWRELGQLANMHASYI